MKIFKNLMILFLIVILYTAVNFVDAHAKSNTTDNGVFLKNDDSNGLKTPTFYNLTKLPQRKTFKLQTDPDLFDFLEINTAEWKRLSVRNPMDKLLDEGYLQRLKISLEKAFMPWFESVEPFNDLPFQETLRLQHILLVTGENGNERYKGATLPLHNYSGPPIPPGQYRYERPDLANANGHFMTFRADAKLKSKSHYLQRMIEFYRKFPTPTKPHEPVDVFPEPLTHPESVIDLFKLPRVDIGVKIWNEIFSQYITHHYPSPRDVPKIISAMAEIMNELKLHSSAITPKTWPVFFELVAEYCYLGIHAHPFEAGNFSLIMSHVNYILVRNGFQGISHENLDYIGLSEHFAEFRKILQTQIADANPNFNFIKSDSLAGGKKEDVILNITAHLSEHGDAFFREGTIIEAPLSKTPLEGLFIFPPDLGENTLLEYKAFIDTEIETEWQKAGSFLGTWGKSKSIRKIAFRISGKNSSKFEVVYKAKIGDRVWSSICKNGELCGSIEQPITGLRVEIKEIKTAPITK